MSAPQSANKEFEAWWDEQAGLLREFLFAEDEEIAARKRSALAVWQAAGRSAIERYTAAMLERGWKMVPVKCTDAMRISGGRELRSANVAAVWSNVSGLAEDTYREILAAAPTPSGSEG